jgi:hypothetical protein
MEANPGVTLDLDTGNEGTEIGVTAQGKRNMRSDARAYRTNHPVTFFAKKGTAGRVAISSTQEISCPFGCATVSRR